MKKLELTALCLAATSPLTAAAQSNVTLYGRADVAINAQKLSGASGIRKSITTDTSFFGLRGTEDLGGGLGAFFKLEANLDISTGVASGSMNLGPGAANATPQFWNREAHVGLRHTAFGQLSLGTHWTPALLLTSPTDPFGRAQTGAAQQLLQGVANRGYVHQFVNSVRYATPAIGGFTGSVLVQAPEGLANKNHALGLTYAGERLLAGLSLDSVQVNGGANNLAGVALGTRSKTLAIGARYAFDAFRLYAWLQENHVAGLPDARGGLLGATMPIGQGELRLTAIRTEIPGREATVTAIGYGHFLSKRTQLYVSAGRLSNSARSRFALYPQSQDKTPATALGLGQDVAGLGVGIRHTF